MKHLVFASLLVAGQLAAAFPAASTPSPGPTPRIRYVAYNKDAVTTVPTALGVSTMIQFAAEEQIETISAGDTKAWSIVPKKGSGIMFIKPLEPDAITNVNVVTNRRVYSLVLRAAADSETRSAFQVRFRYPDEDINLRLLGAAQKAAEFPNLRSLKPGTLNYDYLYKGHESIKPRVTFDNGKKTFLQFYKNADVPAIFLVSAGGKESLVNHRKEGEYIVVDKVAAQFTLRSGAETLCLYNNRANAVAPDPIAQQYGPRPVASGGWSLFGGR